LRALVALAAGIAPNVPGFIAQASGGSVVVPVFFSQLYTYAWFVSLFLSGLVYVILTRLYPVPGQAGSSPEDAE
jgi:nucleobase:cation symporter-1, NCS1 family